MADVPVNPGKTKLVKCPSRHDKAIQVWQDTLTSQLASSHCLCLRCKQTGDCLVAEKLSALHRGFHISTLTTQCPDWKPPEKQRG